MAAYGWGAENAGNEGGQLTGTKPYGVRQDSKTESADGCRLMGNTLKGQSTAGFKWVNRVLCE